MAASTTWPMSKAPGVSAFVPPAGRAEWTDGRATTPRSGCRAGSPLCGRCNVAAEKGDVVVGVARTQEGLTEAFRLVYEAYLRSDLATPNRFKLRVTPHHLLETTEVLIARQGRDLVCTASLVRDGRLGLPMQIMYEMEVHARRAQGIHLAEVSCLADRHRESGHSFEVLSRLMSYIAQLAKNRGVDELLITVHPRHARFYERFLAFETIGGIRECPIVRGNPAVALALDLNNLQANSPRAYRRLFGKPFAAESLAYHPLGADVRSELRAVVEAYMDSGPALAAS